MSTLWKVTYLVSRNPRLALTVPLVRKNVALRTYNLLENGLLLISRSILDIALRIL